MVKFILHLKRFGSLSDGQNFVRLEKQLFSRIVFKSDENASKVAYLQTHSLQLKVLQLDFSSIFKWISS